MNQSQYRASALGGSSNGVFQHSNNSTPRLTKTKHVTRQTQPLSVSQLANIQAQEGDAKKSFNLEDDLEFYPDHIETRRPINMNQRMIMNPALSPYSTPTKTVSYNGQQQVHRLSGYISPGHVINSPQHQQRVLNHTQVFNSPQPQNIAIRGRLDLSNVNASPMYQNQANIRHW
ncbi:hypothetical protein BN7_69 [Wickerhamomyces ciferrii]|uniref:Uncharacterized protein n=1 Tax=Wickerhamomyces ciferrii (strain ATCC 14091 / BCRC 22168 / CBS 111 / JCM 3599 / NBRC 0793 / NRRL Y-1031 F-60-10) TaxID=1206466 RepID=K0KCB1_WICCF|nr:uncharacterized protein BN7_69 [Wickerhamomyces ciferrii]CCH40536.1 hypothetical protein BN7_69 [Wickerhamomyces ciferrii]